MQKSEYADTTALWRYSEICRNIYPCDATAIFRRAIRLAIRRHAP